MARASSPTPSPKRSETETSTSKVDPQALAGTVLSFMRGVEALHEGGVKPAQLKTAAEADDRPHSHRLTGAE